LVNEKLTVVQMRECLDKKLICPSTKSIKKGIISIYVGSLPNEFCKKYHQASYLMLLRGLAAILKEISMGKDGVSFVQELTPLDYAAIHEKKNKEFHEAVNLLKTDMNTLFLFLNQVENLLRDFDSKIMQLYQTQSSLVFNSVKVTLLKHGDLPQTIIENDMPDMVNKLDTVCANRSAAFLVGQENKTNTFEQTSIRASLILAYLKALADIKRFELTEDNKNKKILLPEIVKCKNELLVDFNRKLRELVETCKRLSVEEKMADVLIAKRPKGIIIPDAKSADRCRIASSSQSLLSAYIQPANLIIISRLIQLQELKGLNNIKLKLIDDDEILLLEAEMSYRVSQIESALIAAQHVFVFNPPYLLLSSNELSAENLKERIGTLIQAKNKLEETFQKIINDNKDNPFNYENHADLIVVRKLINKISETLPKNDFDENQDLSILCDTINAVDKDIYNATSMLNYFESSFEFWLHLAYELLEKYSQFVKDISDAKLKIADSTHKYKILVDNQEKNYPDRSKEPLLAIKEQIKAMELQLNSAEMNLKECSVPVSSNNGALAASKCVPFINCNNLNVISSIFDKVKSSILHADRVANEVADAINAQNFSLINASRSGENSFRYGAGYSSSMFHHSSSSGVRDLQQLSQVGRASNQF
jgi:hypothetical protein